MGLKQEVDDAPQRICAGSVSTHALRGEGDVVRDRPMLFCRKFQSTPSTGRATKKLGRAIVRQFISIHALREESDIEPAHLLMGDSQFQSTPSARRATTIWMQPMNP